MKLPKLCSFFFLFLIAVTISPCKKENEEPQLPTETTTGAMTFGFKVNGKVFLTRDGRGRPGLYNQYVNLGTSAGGGWF